ncbi:YhjD/YihY/BrkB family envelope integrity protein [Nitrosococcus watsonii]|uniref:Ribonuclease BN n=1 Tax=Nitrosococcus watsoni (strain C-113) TaxID=105559 RepID=D8K672_NITWC|nr:YhjD/YihY/BrkB family envelope integrity protein [Nitrosococcus watsonii]ADJ28399.1 ribonuclease BN [Nitrosococcus watsonii C-113]
MATLWQKTKVRLKQALRSPERRGEDRWRAFLRQKAKFVYAVSREFFKGDLTLQATSLVYTTLLSLAPLLAVSFSVLKAFGIHNEIEPVLHHFLLPLGPRGEEITTKIIQYVENLKVGVLGSVGVGLLFYTVISLIQKVEGAFNHVWRIKAERPFARRFSDYLSVLLIGPVLVFSAVGATASVMQTSFIQTLLDFELLGKTLVVMSKLLPYLLVIAGFTFIYLFLPNTKVRLGSALVGGAVAGILWETIGILFAFFVTTSTKYDAIYSSFAIVILFMIWLYISWLVLLVGAQVAYYHQNPRMIGLAQQDPLLLSNRLKERVGLLILARVGEAFHQGCPPPTLENLAKHFSLPSYLIEDIIESLKRARLVTATGAEPPGYLLSKDPATVTVRKVLAIIRQAEEQKFPLESISLKSPAVDGIMEKIEQALDQAMKGATLKDLIGDKREASTESSADFI